MNDTPKSTPQSSGERSTELTRVVEFFEGLTPASVLRMAEHYDATARFVDPFNDVQGLPAIEAIFSHMFATLDEPRFVVTTQVSQGQQSFLTWDFHFRFKNFKKREPQCIRGSTHLVFSDTGRVVLHRDYWDAAQELYEKLPLVGAVMRWLRRRASQ